MDMIYLALLLCCTSVCWRYSDASYSSDIIRMLQYTLNLKEDPDETRNVTELITSKGYPCELHHTTTQDGFILAVHRIPHGRHTYKHPTLNVVKTNNDHSYSKKPVVFVQHGLLSSAADWVANLQNESLAFILADAGYDVWLGNFRGSTYSKKHTKYKPDEEKFWDWSWDEMSSYDLPAMIDLCLSVSGQDKLYYIGHSQGTLTLFANPQLQDRVHFFFALAPIVYVQYIKGLVQLLHNYTSEVTILFNILGIHDFLPNNWLIRILANEVCGHIHENICDDVLFAIAGYDTKNLNETRLPVYLYHTPAGTSVKNIIHFSQMVGSGKFEKYNYGCPEKNREHYNQTTPPLYHLSDFTIPTYTFTGSNDWLADLTDYEKVKSELSSLKAEKNVADWNHLDFMWALNAKEEVYDVIIDYIKTHETI